MKKKKVEKPPIQSKDKILDAKIENLHKNRMTNISLEPHGSKISWKELESKIKQRSTKLEKELREKELREALWGAENDILYISREIEMLRKEPNENTNSMILNLKIKLEEKNGIARELSEKIRSLKQDLS